MKALADIDIVIKYLILAMSFFPLIYNISFSFFGILFFGGVAFLGVIQGNPTSSLYLITAPLLASFSLKKTFDLKILYFAFGIICMVFLYEAQRGALDTFKTTSRNYVSVIMLFNSMLISLIAYNQTKKILVWPYVLALFFSLLALGRGGIVCSFLCLMGIILIKIHQLSKRVRYLLLSIVLIFVVGSIPLILDVYEKLDFFERIREKGLKDDARAYIWDAYGSAMNTERLFLGYNLKNDAIISKYGDNPHNSYLFLHAHMGVLVVIPVLLVFYTLFFHIRKKEFIYVIPLFAILLRGFTDVIFMSPYDFIVLIFVLHAFMNKQKVLGDN